jgi:hypothetical protein
MSKGKKVEILHFEMNYTSCSHLLYNKKQTGNIMSQPKNRVVP